MLDRVAAALRESSVTSVTAVVSTDAPETAARASDVGLSTVETPGEGYVADLDAALDVVGRPAVTVAADLPLLTAAHVDDAIRTARTVDTDTDGEAEADEAASVSVCVPADLKRRLGASLDTSFDHEGRTLAPTGLNVVGEAPSDTVRVRCDPALAVNVNRPADLELAEELCD
jgi:adenosylcobinamide-phosphate guanylyltransferase